MSSTAYELVRGDLHRHGRLRHAHPHAGPRAGTHPRRAPAGKPCADRGWHHARVDACVSLAVIASAVAIAVGTPILDPLIGLAMSAVILRIARESWRTVRGHPHRH